MESRYDSIEKIKKLSQDDFEAFINKNRSDIWSFPDMVPPNDAKYIGSLERDSVRYLYYMDTDGNMFYESDRGYIHKKRMRDFRLKEIKK